MKSIFSEECKCFMCGSGSWLEVHHVFGGGNRRKSEKYGLTVHLCHYCHNEPPYGVHHNQETALRLKREAQKAAMAYYNWGIDDFIRIFGRNYL